VQFGQDNGVKQSPEPLVAAADGQPRHQVGALCWRASRSGIEVLLVTSRETGRWVIPKGWIDDGLSAAAAATREAWEEAGVRGRAGTELGVFTYDKVIDRDTKTAARAPCVVAVHAVEVTGKAKDFPEAGQRRVRWFERGKAARKVTEPALQTLILGFDPAGAAPVQG
jgi:8-oxo-dGTP pyrophosphatase MutT (NUDIX family)